MDPSKFQTYTLFFPLNGNNIAMTLNIPEQWTHKFFFLFQKNDYTSYKQTQHNTLIVKGRLATVECQSNNPSLNPDILYAMVKLQGFDILYPTLQLEEGIMNAVYQHCLHHSRFIDFFFDFDNPESKTHKQIKKRNIPHTQINGILLRVELIKHFTPTDQSSLYSQSILEFLTVLNNHFDFFFSKKDNHQTLRQLFFDIILDKIINQYKRQPNLPQPLEVLNDCITDITHNATQLYRIHHYWHSPQRLGTRACALHLNTYNNTQRLHFPSALQLFKLINNNPLQHAPIWTQPICVALDLGFRFNEITTVLNPTSLTSNTERLFHWTNVKQRVIHLLCWIYHGFDILSEKLKCHLEKEITQALYENAQYKQLTNSSGDNTECQDIFNEIVTLFSSTDRTNLLRIFTHCLIPQSDICIIDTLSEELLPTTCYKIAIHYDNGLSAYIHKLRNSSDNKTESTPSASHDSLLNIISEIDRFSIYCDAINPLLSKRYIAFSLAKTLLEMCKKIFPSPHSIKINPKARDGLTSLIRAILNSSQDENHTYTLNEKLVIYLKVCQFTFGARSKKSLFGNITKREFSINNFDTIKHTALHLKPNDMTVEIAQWIIIGCINRLELGNLCSTKVQTADYRKKIRKKNRIACVLDALRINIKEYPAQPITLKAIIWFAIAKAQQIDSGPKTVLAHTQILSTIIPQTKLKQQYFKNFSRNNILNQFSFDIIHFLKQNYQKFNSDKSQSQSKYQDTYPLSHQCRVTLEFFKILSKIFSPNYVAWIDITCKKIVKAGTQIDSYTDFFKVLMFIAKVFDDRESEKIAKAFLSKLKSLSKIKKPRITRRRINPSHPQRINHHGGLQPNSRYYCTPRHTPHFPFLMPMGSNLNSLPATQPLLTQTHVPAYHIANQLWTVPSFIPSITIPCIPPTIPPASHQISTQRFINNPPPPVSIFFPLINNNPAYPIHYSDRPAVNNETPLEMRIN